MENHEGPPISNTQKKIEILKSVKETPFEDKEMDNGLTRIQVDIWRWANGRKENGSSHPLDYLPIFPIVQRPFEGTELIATQSLRDKNLFVSRDSDDTLPDAYDSKQRKRFLNNFDLITIPKDFIQEGSYIALLVPDIDFNKKFKLELMGYSVALLFAETKDKLVNPSAHHDSVSRRLLNERSSKIPGMPVLPTYISDDGTFDNRLIRIDANAQKSDKIPIKILYQETRDRLWELFKKEAKQKTARSFEEIYKRIIDGTVCYKFIEGKPQKEKKKVFEKVRVRAGLPELTPAPARKII